MSASKKDHLTAELREAEAALLASEKAMKTHGHQGITWALLNYDVERVEELRAALAVAEGRTP